MPATETAEAPPTEESPGLHPDLIALLDKVMPKDAEPAEEQPELPVGEEPDGEPKKPEVEAPKEPKVEPRKVEPKKDDIQSRLAPDIAPEKKEQPKEPEVEITDEMIDSAKTPKAKADLRKFREALNHYKGEVARLTTAAPAPKTEDPGAQAIIEQQKQQIEQLSQTVQRIELKAHPRFQQALVIPRNQMMSDAQAIVKDMGGDPDALEKAMSLSGKAKVTALDDIVSGVESTVLRDKLGRLLDGIESKDREIENLLKDSKTTAANLARQDKISHHEMVMQQEQQLKSLLGAARKDLAENLKFEPLHKTNKPEFKWWDDQVDEIDATAHSILFEGTPDKMAVAAILAASAGPLRSMWQAERKARVAAEERLAAIEGAEPDLGDKTKVRDAAVDVPEDADMATAVIARLRAKQ